MPAAQVTRQPGGEPAGTERAAVPDGPAAVARATPRVRVGVQRAAGPGAPRRARRRGPPGSRAGRADRVSRAAPVRRVAATAPVSRAAPADPASRAARVRRIGLGSRIGPSRPPRGGHRRGANQRGTAGGVPAAARRGAEDLPALGARPPTASGPSRVDGPRPKVRIAGGDLPVVGGRAPRLRPVRRCGARGYGSCAARGRGLRPAIAASSPRLAAGAQDPPARRAREPRDAGRRSPHAGARGGRAKVHPTYEPRSSDSAAREGLASTRR